jgi:hypothetical protein
MHALVWNEGLGYQSGQINYLWVRPDSLCVIIVDVP